MRKKLEDYALAYSALFRCGRKNNARRCAEYLKGLFHECKSNIERMTEHIADSNYQQLQHFISHSEWSAEAVMQEAARKTAGSLQGLSGSIGLILDESGNEKSGKKSVGVARQYIGNIGKVCNAQVGVFAALVRQNRVALCAGKLYLPREWTNDRRRMRAAGVPETEQKYRSKPELAAELIEQLPEALCSDWIGGDTIYGNSPHLRERFRAAGKAFVLDVGEQLKVYLIDPEPFVPLRAGNGRGRKPVRLVSHQSTKELRELIKEIEPERWQAIEYRSGSKERLEREAVLLPVFIWDGKTEKVESVWLIISRALDGKEIKYAVCFEPSGELQIKEALPSTNAAILGRESIPGNQRTAWDGTISSAFVDGMASSHCFNNDGITLYSGNADRRERSLAAVVVRGCETDAGADSKKQTG